jgi:hypothetical protein
MKTLFELGLMFICLLGIFAWMITFTHLIFTGHILSGVIVLALGYLTLKKIL